MNETPRGSVEVVLTSFKRVETSQGPLPAALDYNVTGENGDPDFTAKIKVMDGRPELVSFTATAKPDGRGLRSVDIGTNVDTIIRSAYASLSIVLRDSELPGKVERSRRGRPVRITRARLEEAARVYRENIDGKPVLAVQEHLELGTRRTAEMYVQRAREAGILPPTTRGKRKA